MFQLTLPHTNTCSCVISSTGMKSIPIHKNTRSPLQEIRLTYTDVDCIIKTKGDWESDLKTLIKATAQQWPPTASAAWLLVKYFSFSPETWKNTLIKISKSLTKPTGSEMKRNTTNFDSKQKGIWKWEKGQSALATLKYELFHDIF